MFCLLVFTPSNYVLCFSFDRMQHNISGNSVWVEFIALLESVCTVFLN